MKRLSLTPARRQPIPAGQLPEDDTNEGAIPVSKWAVMRRLSIARRAFGLSDRALSVLNALLTFHPREMLAGDDPIIVFPSNASLSARAHGMPESTLRRHLASLVQAGVLWRHDSPNGKRFARRGQDGGLARAFGFDISPLLRRAPEIHAAAEAAELAAETRRLQREDCVLALRDITALLAGSSSRTDPEQQDHIDACEAAGRALRRQLSSPDLCALRNDLLRRRDTLATRARVTAAEELSGTDGRNERHHHKSDTEFSDDTFGKTITLSELADACPDVDSFLPGATESWTEFETGTQRLAGMLGIDYSLWSSGIQEMGSHDTAATVACILQRLSTIRSPAAYFRSLVSKARDGAYTPRSMLDSLAAVRARYEGDLSPVSSSSLK